MFGIRELNHCPLHFVQIKFNLKTSQKAISDWIWTNLDGRFWIGDWYYKDEGNNVQIQKCVAFEIPGEASMFALMLDQLNTYEHEW